MNSKNVSGTRFLKAGRIMSEDSCDNCEWFQYDYSINTPEGLKTFYVCCHPDRFRSETCPMVNK